MLGSMRYTLHVLTQILKNPMSLVLLNKYMRKLRHRKLKLPAKDFIAIKYYHMYLRTGSLSPGFTLFSVINILPILLGLF